MKITDVEAIVLRQAVVNEGIADGSQDDLVVRIHTDEGITGIGEASGWPRVIQTAIEDFKGVIVGEDPGRIERIWQKMLIAMMGHGMTGVVGAGAMTGIEMALWDILGKAVTGRSATCSAGESAIRSGCTPTPTTSSGRRSWLAEGSARSSARPWSGRCSSSATSARRSATKST